MVLRVFKPLILLTNIISQANNVFCCNGIPGMVPDIPSSSGMPDGRVAVILLPLIRSTRWWLAWIHWNAFVGAIAVKYCRTITWSFGCISRAADPMFFCMFRLTYYWPWRRTGGLLRPSFFNINPHAGHRKIVFPLRTRPHETVANSIAFQNVSIHVLTFSWNKLQPDVKPFDYLLAGDIDTAFIGRHCWNYVLFPDDRMITFEPCAIIPDL